MKNELPTDTNLDMNKIFKMVETIDVTYPIPISNGRIITINNLPVELNKEDAEKICRIVMALSENKVIPPPEDD